MKKYTICTENLDWIKEKIGVYNKKAKKLNMPNIELSEGKIYCLDVEKNSLPNQEVEDVFQYKKSIEVLDIEITEVEPLVFDKGYIVAKIEHFTNKAGKNKIKAYTKEILHLDIEKLQNLDSTCEHCNSKRRRKITYLIKIKNEEKFIQVGKSCMKNYTSIYNIDTILSMYDLLEEINFEATQGAKGDRIITQYPTTLILYLLEKIVKQNGYMSYKKSQELLWENMKSVPPTFKILEGKINEKIIQPTEEEKNELIEKIEYYKNYDFMKYIIRPKYDRKSFKLSEEDLKEKFFESFNYKLLEILQNDYIREAEFPVISAFFTSLEILKNTKEKIDNKDNEAKKIEFYGKIKEKIDIVDAELTNINSYEACFNGYNTTTQYTYTFKKNNNVFVWKTSKDLELEKNTIVNLKGTIKEHNTFNNISQTVITRCKIV